MTQVDFHVNLADKFAYACRLVRKVRQSDRRVVVHCDDDDALERIDRALWSFAPLEFIPHVRATDAVAARTPVLLATGEQALAHYDVLVNLGCAPPACFTRFERLLELVSDEDEDRQAGRARYRHYKDRGYPLSLHEIRR
ncbi:MAG: DNA polymerase III subunit chi [Lautropia sp.]